MNRLVSCLVLLAALLSLNTCQQANSAATNLPFVKLQGQTMGTYYTVTYSIADQVNFQKAIDSVLNALNLEVSTYIPTSTISSFNQAERGIAFVADEVPHFAANFNKSRELVALTKGNFEPTIMPLGNYWGFGYTPKNPVTVVDSNKVDSLKAFVGFDKIMVTNDSIIKKVAGIEVDFSALAKGYGVDAVSLLLEEKGIENYLVDIGGEVRAKGKNAKGMDWTVGINKPQENVSLTEIVGAVSLINKSMATSGNYRNLYEVNGVKYVHTINPFSGFPEINDLLSASILADDCMTADALATACMVMGLEKAYEFIEKLPNVEGYFVFDGEGEGFEIKYTSGMKDLIKM